MGAAKRLKKHLEKLAARKTEIEAMMCDPLLLWDKWVHPDKEAIQKEYQDILKETNDNEKK